VTAPPGHLDLAARWLGGGVVAASDESFGFKENLLVTADAAFEPGHYDHRGEIVDGWETRRRREGDHDWVIVRLGAAGRITAVDVDTSFFTGNFPISCRLEALAADGYPGVAELTAADAPWSELVAGAPLRGDAHNLIDIEDPRRFTHVRLSAYPDGGIARLRVFGTVIADPRRWDGVTVELSGAAAGGQVRWSSDEFYSSAHRLIRPDRPATMGEGWETARRRHGGHDAVVIELAASARLVRAEIDTTHFKYNASAAFELWGASEGAESITSTTLPSTLAWRPLLPRTPLQPDTRHEFDLAADDVAVVRLDAFPDGGLARLRLLGHPTATGRAEAEQRWRAARPERILPAVPARRVEAPS